jgi:hypothetical protein
MQLPLEMIHLEKKNVSVEHHVINHQGQVFFIINYDLYKRNKYLLVFKLQQY